MLTFPKLASLLLQHTLLRMLSEPLETRDYVSGFPSLLHQHQAHRLAISKHSRISDPALMGSLTYSL